MASTPSWFTQYINETETSALSKKGGHSAYPDPPGFNKDIILSSKTKSGKEVSGPTSDERDTLKIKKAWEIALAPSKSLPMNAIMSYFSGSSLQIFSLTMTFMLFSNPIKAIANVGPAFSRYEGESTGSRLLQAKLVFIGLQLLTIAVGIWKMGSMGVLPTKRSDWLAWEEEAKVFETGVFVP
ncbi:hypothetical protein V1511DRAFT_507625 [Dipodascopsis uninucleata]